MKIQKNNKGIHILRKMINTKIIQYSIFFVVLMGMITGCSVSGAQQTQVNQTQQIQSVAVSKPANIYDSQDTAVVVKKDLEAKTIQLQNITTSRRYTLNYSGVTKLYDKYEQAISMDQLKEGSIVTARFYKADKSLSYIKAYTDCIHYSNIENYAIDLKKGTISIGDEVYNLSAHIVVSSAGKEIDLIDVNQIDVISVWGSNSMIYGINVERGHGYLRLQNETYFTNGWIDVGDKVIKKITDDMLLTVPEGTYNVTVSNKGSSATQEITFNRNEEMAWDLGEIEIKVVQKGKIIFTLSPATAKLYIDGRQVDSSKPVQLEYGLHRMKIMAEGYETVSQYIKVAEESATIEAELEKLDAAEEESSSESSTSDNEDKKSDTKSTGNKSESKNDTHTDEEESIISSSVTDKDDETESEENKKDETSATDSKYMVYIDAPEGVEAYLDGNYIGITPLKFPKKSGNYVVTLRKTGYQTRSYTLQIDDEEKDINYSFTELLELDE